MAVSTEQEQITEEWLDSIGGIRVGGMLPIVFGLEDNRISVHDINLTDWRVSSGGKEKKVKVDGRPSLRRLMAERNIWPPVPSFVIEQYSAMLAMAFECGDVERAVRGVRESFRVADEARSAEIHDHTYLCDVLTMKTANLLETIGVCMIDDLQSLTLEDLWQLPNCGEGTVAEIRSFCEEQETNWPTQQ